ncbi:hypothetical protein A2160_01815 [Candidatus Beckwithbacteria bacterium RBG_13_42_9]|uniref:Uncharacterized protein n=1 Tax=Candidatus Beckwithbacteria bacterium RBG_13_42_9 TaxID=1797457 RepID=A0A1F5E858_9BACT|nr:MAG: hypothetical protein A2160_01815 [Candidatus Beckwithbacteria bacterium RBG_13_42_9]
MTDNTSNIIYFEPTLGRNKFASITSPYVSSKPVNTYSWQNGASSDYSQIDNDYYKLVRNSFNTVLESDIYDQLRNFEKKYREDSAAFYKLWLEGRKEDTEDFNNWASLYSLVY